MRGWARSNLRSFLCAGWLVWWGQSKGKKKGSFKSKIIFVCKMACVVGAKGGRGSFKFKIIFACGVACVVGGKGEEGLVQS